MKVSASDLLDVIRGHRNRTPAEDRENWEPDQYDEGLLAIVAYLDEVIRWAWGEAFDVPIGPKPRGVVHRPLSDEQKAQRLKNPDYVPGGKLEITTGDYLSQDALRNAARRLGAADVALDHACLVCGPERSGEKRRLPVVARIENCALHEYAHTLTTIRWRLNYLAGRAKQLDELHRGHVLKWLRRADRHLTATRGKFELAQRNATRNASILADRTCVTCERRAARRAGLECNTCEVYRRRHDGEPRPKELDAA